MATARRDLIGRVVPPKGGPLRGQRRRIIPTRLEDDRRVDIFRRNDAAGPYFGVWAEAGARAQLVLLTRGTGKTNGSARSVTDAPAPFGTYRAVRLRAAHRHDIAFYTAFIAAADPVNEIRTPLPHVSGRLTAVTSEWPALKRDHTQSSHGAGPPNSRNVKHFFLPTPMAHP